MQNHVAVGLSELKVTGDPDEVLVAYSLGSCVGFALWDPLVRVGGLAHIVLPFCECAAAPVQASVRDEVRVELPGKYADTAVPTLVAEMIAAGCQVRRLQAYMAGGAHVLRGFHRPGGDIGAANVKAALSTADKMGIRVLKMDVGEDYGRTMRLYVSTGRVTVSSFGREERDL